MIKAIDIANFYVDLANSKDDYETNLKLNKLLYFAQGVSLARTGKPLFDEDIEAWQFGPVVPSVYHAFKVCGNKPIINPSNDYDLSELDEEQLQVIFDVARTYGRFTGSALVDFTHADGTPWKDVYVNGVHNIVIPKKTIKDHFLKKKNKSLFDDSLFTEIESVGFRDEDGILVLPKEYDDEQ